MKENVVMKYENFNFTNKKLILESINSDISTERKIEIIVGMVNSIEDWKWIQDILLSLVDHKEFWIAKNAISGLGDIARIHGRLDVSLVRNRLSEVKSPEMEGFINDTLDDIKIFVK
ncbi:hypothetical protein D3C87_228170 [compost metagenome]